MGRGGGREVCALAAFCVHPECGVCVPKMWGDKLGIFVASSCFRGGHVLARFAWYVVSAAIYKSTHAWRLVWAVSLCVRLQAALFSQ